MKRKVIQILTINDTEYAQGCFMALCDDGSIWDRQLKRDREESGRYVNARFEWVLVDGPPEEII